MRPPVELLPAWTWSCPECRHDNFLAATPHNLPPEEAEALIREHLELEPWQQLPEDASPDCLLQAPEYVRCTGCRRKYPVGQGEDEA